MAEGDVRNLAFVLGAVGALILILAALIDFVRGSVFFAVGLGGHALGEWARSVVYVVIALLFGGFAVLGRSGGWDRKVGAGAVLVVLAIVGWVALGFGGELLALFAALFALLSGILFLVSRP